MSKIRNWRETETAYERKLAKQAEKCKAKNKKLAIARKLAYVNDMA